MNDDEYRWLQRTLSKKLKDNPYGSKALFKYEEGYKEGILTAKSILSSFYKKKE